MPDAYVAVTLAGVQEFISASRRTADLSVSSMLMSRLCAVAVSAVQSGGGQVVLPQVARQDAGLPNRLFAVVPAGHAARLAGEATKAIRGEWHRLAKLALPTTDPTVEAGLATFPFVRWVAWDRIAEQSAPAHAYGYLDGWRAVGQASAARRRVRDFSPYIGASGNACSLCGRRQGSSWSTTVAPRVADGERLCAVCVIKRSPAVSRDLAGASVAFPSTASVAVAPFRARVREVLVASSTQSPLADAVREHQRQVRRVGALLRELGASDPGDRPLPEAPPGLEDTAESLDEDVARWFRLDGGWLQQDTWQPLSLLRENRVAGSTADQVADLELVCRAGRLACVKVADGLAAGRRELQGGSSGEDAGRSAPAVYLALMVQDADDMGSQLSAPDEPPPGESPGEWPREWHRRISAVLAAAAGGQAQAMRDGWGRAVYAGGDDLVGLLPAAQALPVAQRCREVFVQRASGLLRRPRVSTGLVFFHHSYPLQEALRRAREALAAAKARPGKDQLSVVVLRRGGERAAAVLPWTRRGTVPAQSLAALADAFRGPLSAGLLADVHRERWGIAELAAAGLAYQTEMLRLVNRHWSTPALGPSDADSVVPARLVADLEPSTVRRPEDVDAWLAALEVARFLSAEAR